MSDSPARTRIRFLAIALGFAAVSSLQSLLIPVLTVIGGDLGADTVGTTWTLTAWLITAAVATPLLGRAGDIIGKRRVFLLALLAVIVGSVIAAFAPNLPVMLGARILQGVGAAVFPLGFGLVRDGFPAHRVPSVIGVLAAVLAVGSGLGTVVAGPVAAAIGWRALFALPVLLGAASLVLAVRGLDESARQPGARINITAAVLLSGWLVAILLPLSMASQWGWGSPLVIGLLAVGAALLALWVIVEVRSAEPLVDMRMMRLPGVWTTNLTALVTGAGMFGIWAFLPRFAETPAASGYGLGASVSFAGIIMLPMLVVMAVVGFVIGPLSRLLPFRALLAIGAGISALASVSAALFHASPLELAVAGALLGLGSGLITSSTPNLIVRSVPAAQTGIATGMNSNIRTIGGALGTTVFASIVASSVPAGSPLPTEGGYVAAFAVGAVLAGIGAVAPFLARSARPEPQVHALPVAESPLGEAEGEIVEEAGAA